MSRAEDQELNEILKNAPERRGSGDDGMDQASPKLVAHGESPMCMQPATFSGGLIQWTTSDGKIFVPASHTAKKLTPGVYEVKHCDSIGTYFEKIPVLTAGLIRFPETNCERVVQEIQKFWDREPIFREYKLTYKRGIILWGPPGSGKSCTIQFIMRDVVERGGVVVKFCHPGLFVDGMRKLREIQPDTPIVILMEDIDATLEKYDESEVLNILDGINQIEKAVFLACPSPDHLILKSDLTWVRADSLTPGDELIAFDDEGDIRFRTAKVNSCPVVDRPCFRVTDTSGKSFVVSEKHPFLVKLGNRPHEWRVVEDLRPGNRIVSIGKPWTTDESREAGYMAGQYDGEGTLNFTYKAGFRVNWVQASGPVANNIEHLLEDRGFEPVVYKKQPVGNGRFGPYKEKTSINVLGGRWESLRLLGSIRPQCLLAHPNLREAWEGARLHTTEYVVVSKVEAIGMGPVVALDTTTKTFIGEGMLQHNTTNYPERLGARIMNRPSRFDKRFKIGHPSEKSRRIYFEFIMGGPEKVKALKIDLEKWVKDTEDFSIAHLKELFTAVVILGDDYEEAVEALSLMREKKPHSDEDEVRKPMGFMNAVKMGGAKRVRHHE
jgi:SpoVK/Ycf46/Vps4 family AAA+-type ATPase